MSEPGKRGKLCGELISFVGQSDTGWGRRNRNGKSIFQVFVVVISNLNSILETLEKHSFKKGGSFKTKLSCKYSVRL